MKHPLLAFGTFICTIMSLWSFSSMHFFASLCFAVAGLVMVVCLCPDSGSSNSREQQEESSKGSGMTFLEIRHNEDEKLQDQAYENSNQGDMYDPE